MLRNVLLKTLWEKRRALLWWSLGIFSLGLYLVLFYPSIQQMPELNKLMEAIPEPLLKTLVGEYMDFVSPAGYLTTELNLTMAVLFITFAVVQGANLLAAEEEAGTLEMVLATPLRRLQVGLEKAAALLVMTAGLTLVLWLALVIGAVLVDMEIGWDKLAALSIMGGLLGLFHGALALGLGAWWGKTGLAGGLSAAIALAGYTWNAMTLIVERLEPYKVLSPFYYYLANDPARQGLAVRDVGFFLIGSVLFIALGLWRFDRRDLRV